MPYRKDDAGREWHTFSSPPTYSGEEFKIIDRPEIPHLDEVMKRYLRDDENRKADSSCQKRASKH